MSTPLVTVIVPAYNAEDLIGGAIQSVLDQSYPHFELLITDDKSTDGTREVVRRFTDPRVKLLEHPVNRGPDFARATALHASKGEIIALLDQDDVLLSGKLAAHVDFLSAHPDVGLTYNPFLVRTYPGDRIQTISRPPAALTLADLILGFPLPPSTWVIRRSWALLDELWDEQTMFRGREVVFCGRLFMAGCRFALVDQVLSHRREHVGRRFADPVAKCQAERRCQEILLDDARCTDGVRAVRGQAEANAWLVWAKVASHTGDRGGRELCVRHWHSPGVQAKPNAQQLLSAR
jgi:glycosyltransferase involved in cell wall biosynthesis